MLKAQALYLRQPIWRQWWLAFPFAIAIQPLRLGEETGRQTDSKQAVERELSLCVILRFAAF